MKLAINGAVQEFSDDWIDESLLHVLREALGLVGAKFGCGLGQCGACTVIVDGEARRSCLEIAGSLEGVRIETIEGLGKPERPHPLQSAWMNQSVPQCGYCQAGQIMSAAALLRKTPHPTDEEIDASMEGNLCRCGTYQRIRTAIKQAAEALS